MYFDIYFILFFEYMFRKHEHVFKYQSYLNFSSKLYV